MSLCATLFFVFFCATISSFGQTATVRLIEGKWRDLIDPSKTEKLERSAVVGAGQMPNDPLISRQREMFERTGMVRAWQRYGLGLSSRLSSVPVVEIDTGVDESHPDLEGLVDCGKSQTFIEGGGSPCVDEWGHGTPVATIGYARGNDARGVAGFGWNQKVISYKVMTAGNDQFGRRFLRTSLDAVIKAFRAVKELSKEYPLVIVNTSFSIDGVDPVLNALMRELDESGKVFLVSATDNIALDSEGLPGLPCFVSVLSNSLCVASTTMLGGGLAPWSAYGTRINYTARCENIVASYPGTRVRYGTFTGNSGCAPQISAVAALVASYLAENGREVSASELKSLMLRGAAFAPGLVSAIRQQEILFPITLDVERLFKVAEKVLLEESAVIRPLSLEKSLRAETLKDAEGKQLFEISPATYKVVGEGFNEKTMVFLNGMPIEMEVVSPTELWLKLGEEASLFGGSNNVIYLAMLDDGEVDPFSVTKVLSGFVFR